MSKITPIKPSEAILNIDFPDWVISATNILINRNFKNGKSTFTKNALIDEMWDQYQLSESPIETSLTFSNMLYDKGYLDVEDTYREIGWRVSYNNPAYNETYPATYTFWSK